MRGKEATEKGLYAFRCDGNMCEDSYPKVRSTSYILVGRFQQRPASALNRKYRENVQEW